MYILKGSRLGRPSDPLGGECVCSAEGSVVFSAVCDQVGALTEGFTTHFTNMWLLSRVYEGVFLHVGFLVESLATVLTGIRPCVRVDQEVGGQSGRAFEYLPTFLTLKCSFLYPTWHHRVLAVTEYQRPSMMTTMRSVQVRLQTSKR